MRICDAVCFFGPYSLYKYIKIICGAVFFNKSTEINTPPQVFLSFNEAYGPELRMTSRVLFAVK